MGISRRNKRNYLILVLSLIVVMNQIVCTESDALCPPMAIIECLQLLEIGDITQNKVKMFSAGELQTICDHENLAFGSCLKPIKDRCDATLSISFKAVEDQLAYTCSTKGTTGYILYGACLNDTNVQTALSQCRATHQEQTRRSSALETDYEKSVCRSYNTYEDCTKDAATSACGLEAGEWLMQMAQSSSMAVSDLLNCTQYPANTKPSTTTDGVVESSTVSFQTALTNECVCDQAHLDVCISMLNVFPFDPMSIVRTDEGVQNFCSSTSPAIITCSGPRIDCCTVQQRRDISVVVATYRDVCLNTTSPGLEEYRNCISQSDVVPGLDRCFTLYKAETSTQKNSSNADHWCGATQKYLDCVRNVTYVPCGPDASYNIWNRMTSIFNTTTKEFICAHVFTARSQFISQSNLSDEIVIGVGISGIFFIIFIIGIAVSLLHCRTKPPHRGARRIHVRSDMVEPRDFPYPVHVATPVTCSEYPSISKSITRITHEGMR